MKGPRSSPWSSGAARRALEKAQRADGWFNTISGVGVSNSRAAMSFAVGENEYLDLATIDTLYNFDGIAARVCDSVPDHALRQGFAVSTGVSEVETAIRVALDGLKALPTLKRAWTWGRLFGGGAVLLGCDDGADLCEPIDLGSLRAVRWLYDVDRRDLFPLTWETDPNAQRFGQPILYTLNRMGGTAAQTVTVHASRLLRFEGATPSRRRRLMLQGWGDSVLQRCFSEIQAARAAFAASGELVQQASQGVLKLKGLMDMMASDTDDLVKRRLYLMDLSRSVARSMLLDADGEDFTRVDAGSLTGVAEIMDRNINLLAAVSRIPVTVLMGQAPAGLNATGDSDIRNWYDALQAEREAVLREPLTKLVKLVLRSAEGPTRGVEPEGWRVVLPSLWQATPTEQADLELKVAQRDQIYVTAQVLTPEEVAVSRFRKEGWSADTSIDLDTREAIIAADNAKAEGDPSEPVGGTSPAPKADGGALSAAVVLPIPSELAARLAIPGGELAGDLHLTLAYVPLAGPLQPGTADALAAVVREWAVAHAAIPATGVGRFSGGPEGDPVYLAVDAPRLTAAREELVQMLASAGFQPSELHGFTPHVTLAYLSAGSQTPLTRIEPERFVFEVVGVWMGDVRVHVPMANTSPGTIPALP